jgi:DNA-binding response OmpR family regulator
MPSSLKVLVYSDDSTTRQAIMVSLGRTLSPELPPLEFIECATEPMVVRYMDAGGIDLAILDAEAVPAGGMGVCRALKDEIYQCPPIMLIIAREQDGWLATWSRADAVALQPLDPFVVSETVAKLLRSRISHA